MWPGLRNENSIVVCFSIWSVIPMPLFMAVSVSDIGNRGG